MLNKCLKKYNSLSVQLKVVFWFTFVGFLQRGISIITTPIFTRTLSTQEYGMYNVFYSWYSVIAIVATLYLHNGVINNAFVKINKCNEKIVSSMQSLSLVVSSFFFVIGFVFSDKISDFIGLPQFVVIVALVGFMFMEPYQDWMIYKRYNFEYVMPVIVSVVISLLTPIVSLITVLLVEQGKGVARITSFVIVNTVIPGIIFYIINYKKNKTFFDWDLWKYALKFNVPLIPHYLSETLLNQTDRIMINMVYSSSEAGIYSVAFSVASLIVIFTSALNTALVPWQYQKLKERNYKSIGKIAYGVLVFVSIILILFILFAPEMVFVIAGKKYMGAVYLIPTLGASAFFNYLYQLFSRIELYYEKKAYSVIATVSATIINIILNVIWLPKYGYLAAGYSTLLSHILMCVMHYIFYRKINKSYMQSKKVYDGRILVAISIVVILFSFVMTLLYNWLLARIITLICILFVIGFYKRKIINMVKILLDR